MSSYIKTTPAYSPTPLSASADAVVSGPGVIHGIFVSSVSGSPTLAVRDSLVNGSGGTVIVATFIPVASTFYTLDAFFAIGCSITMGGTVVYTAMTNKANVA